MGKKKSEFPGARVSRPQISRQDACAPIYVRSRQGPHVLVLVLLIIVNLFGCAFTHPDRISSWHAYRSSGQAALSKGDYGGAQSSFQAALDQVATLPNEGQRTAISLKDLSAVCLHTQDQRLAERLAKQALAAALKLQDFNTNSESSFVRYELGQALCNLGDYYKETKDFSQAASLYQKAESIFAALIANGAGINDSCFAGYHLAKSLCGLGQSLAAAQNEKQAEQAYAIGIIPQLCPAIPELTRRQLVLSYAELPVSSAEKAAYALKLGIVLPEKQVPENLCYHHLARGRAMIRANQFPAALSELLEAQALAEKLPQPSFQLADVLQTLGISYIKQEKFADAETVLLRALSILDKTSKEDPKQICDCLFTIGTLYERSGQAAKAEPYALRRRALWFDALGASDAETIKSDIFAGEIYFDEKKYDLANKYYQEALQQLTKNYRVERRLLARVHTCVAQILIAQNDYARAKEALEQARDIWSANYQTDPKAAELTETLYTDVCKHLGEPARVSVHSPDFRSPEP